MKKILILLAIFTSIVATAQSVGINADGSSANASAMLDVSSTTKGFLPPRMTYAQRETITSPAIGLMIYCTNCGPGTGEPQFYNGSAWVNMIGGTALSISSSLLSSFTRSSGEGNCSWALYETGYLETILGLKNDYYGASLLELSATLTNGQTSSVSYTAANTANFASQVLYLSNLNYQYVSVQIGGGAIGFNQTSTNPNWGTSFGPLQGKTITEIKLVPVSVSITNATSGNCDPYSYNLRWEFYGY